MEKIRFRDLSGSLKTLVVFGWILFGIYTLAISVGFLIGFIGAFI